MRVPATVLVTVPYLSACRAPRRDDHAPDVDETSASVSPGNESNFAASMNSKSARLMALAREDDAKLERRRAQLLAKKTWLREHLLARGE